MRHRSRGDTEHQTERSAEHCDKAFHSTTLCQEKGCQRDHDHHEQDYQLSAQGRHQAVTDLKRAATPGSSSPDFTCRRAPIGGLRAISIASSRRIHRCGPSVWSPVRIVDRQRHERRFGADRAAELGVAAASSGLGCHPIFIGSGTGAAKSHASLRRAHLGQML